MTGKKLYYTPNSPYSRIARVAARESGLIDGVEEIEATTRDAKTSYFEVTPLARVPVLVDGAVMLAETRDICAYFDELTGKAQWFPKEDHETRYLRHIVSGFLDGIAVWVRENYRPEGQKSEPVKAYEDHRARQALAWLEAHWQPGSQKSYTDLVLACAIDIAIDRGLGRSWEAVAPKAIDWARCEAMEPAMRVTAPRPV